MAKTKLRTIVVDGKTYRWRFQKGYEKTKNPLEPYRCKDDFLALAEENRSSPLKIFFDTWECSIIGGPLRTGAPVDLNDPGTGGINLHTPKWAAALIRAGLERGWLPDLCVIEDGVKLLSEMGFRAD